MTHTARLANGAMAIGSSALRKYPGKRIYAFRIHNTIWWTGDLEILRKTKREAFADLGIEFSLEACR